VVDVAAAIAAGLPDTASLIVCLLLLLQTVSSARDNVHAEFLRESTPEAIEQAGIASTRRIAGSLASSSVNPVEDFAYRRA
jgi:hypothetical protein